MSPVYCSGLCENEYHTVKKLGQLAKSFPEVFLKIIFRFTSQKFSLEGRAGGELPYII